MSFFSFPAGKIVAKQISIFNIDPEKTAQLGMPVGALAEEALGGDGSYVKGFQVL